MGSKAEEYKFGRARSECSGTILSKDGENGDRGTEGSFEGLSGTEVSSKLETENAEELRFLLQKILKAQKERQIIKDLLTTNILSLKSVSLDCINKLPSVSGIYFVFFGSFSVYFGRARNIKQRWRNHHKFEQIKQCFPESRIHWLECPRELTYRLESCFIHRDLPPLNIGLPKFQIETITRKNFLYLSQYQFGELSGIRGFNWSYWFLCTPNDEFIKWLVENIDAIDMSYIELKDAFHERHSLENQRRTAVVLKKLLGITI